MARVVTVVLQRDGSLHLASDKISLADSERWADEGYFVFRLATVGRRWAVNQLPSGKIFTDNMMPSWVDEDTSAVFSPLLIEHKGEKR